MVLAGTLDRCLAIFRSVHRTAAVTLQRCWKKAKQNNYYLRYVTRQLFRQFRSDQFISKLSIIAAVYKPIWIIHCKQNNMQWKNPHSYSNGNKIYKDLFFVVEGFWAENVQSLQFLLKLELYSIYLYF